MQKVKNLIQKSLPLIVTDIDGVLVHNGKPLQKARRTLKSLRQPLYKLCEDKFEGIQDQLPLIFLTNNCKGNLLEHEKAEQLNEYFHLDQQNGQGLTQENVILNYTAIKPYIEKHSDGIVMLTGANDMDKFVNQWNCKNYITLLEYAALFPDLVPITQRTEEDRLKMVEIIKERLPQLKDSDFEYPFKVDAIFVLGDCISWNEHIQIICDLLSSEDGNIPRIKPKQAPKTTIPLYWANNSCLYKDRVSLPRIGCGMMKIGLEQAYKIMFNDHLDDKIIMFGKPQRSSFEFAQVIGQEQTTYPIHKTYMIGDTIYTDIQGANQFGWETILIRPGLHKRITDNHREGSPAKYVVRDFEEAIKLIYNLEGLNYRV